MKNKTKILFYYAGFRNSDEPSGGVCKALINFIKLTSELMPDYHIDVMGDLVKDDEIIAADVLLFKTPKSDLEKLLSGYTIFFPVMHLGVFKNIVKPVNQIWVYLAHCWNKSPLLEKREQDFDVVVALSDIHKQNLSKQSFSLEKIYVVSNILDDVFLREHKCERKPYSIMFAGALVKHKGLDKLIEAFNLVKTKYPKTILDVYGDDKIWRDEKNILSLNEKDLEKKDIFLKGTVSYTEMPVVYASHSILVLPSDLESFSLVCAEAQSQKCIPIAHNSGGVSAVINDYINGFLYSPNTVETLAEKIIEVFAILDKDESIRNEALLWAKESFFAHNISASLVNLFNSLEN